MLLGEEQWEEMEEDVEGRIEQHERDGSKGTNKWKKQYK